MQMTIMRLLIGYWQMHEMSMRMPIDRLRAQRILLLMPRG